jgi:hypothetical protein
VVRGWQRNTLVKCTCFYSPQGVGQVLGKVSRIVLGAVDVRRLAPPQHRQAQGVHARCGHDATVMPQTTFVIEHRQL